MKAKTVLILEDNVQTANVIRDIILGMDSCIDVEMAETVAQAYVISMEKTIDVFILDIILITNYPGDTSGMRFAQKIRDIRKYFFTPIVFITALADPELYAYKDIRCFGYIEKPFDKKQVENILDQALLYSTQDEDNKKVFLRKDGIIYAVNLMDIIYIQVRHHKMFVYTQDDLVEIPYKTMKAFLQENNNMYFLQCNRSTLVNCKYVENIDMVNRCIKLKGISECLDIGVAYRSKLLEWSNACEYM